jgi:hypothetical protein
MVKTYVLEIIFDEDTEECIGLREYIDFNDTVLNVNGEKLKINRKLGDLLDSSIMGVS